MCPTCQYVSKVGKVSDLKVLPLRGCQRRGCPECFQWGEESPYEPEDTFYEGRKDTGQCPWYTSGRGCARGNKCNLIHPKWDETLKENKRRCYVCGQKADHTSVYCERPGEEPKVFTSVTDRCTSHYQRGRMERKRNSQPKEEEGQNSNRPKERPKRKKKWTSLFQHAKSPSHTQRLN